MSSAPVLHAQGLGKAYRVYASEWQRLARWFGVPVTPREEHWVLRELSFTLAAGEALGIVGQNGAGKSTLLKILTGTLQPSEGQLQVHGAVGAILELGMGFNGEFSGRQNVIHAAGLLGHGQAQIQATLPEIEAFAEIGEYFDEPVRTYSSGMQMRVAFAVATAWQPQILIVDEALSVGDAYFQHKSFDRIRALRAQGTALLLVSHDRSAIQALCDRALLLDHGRLLKDGDPQTVMDYYNALIAEKGNQTVTVRQLDDQRVQTRSGTGEARVQSIGLYNARGELLEVVSVGEPVELRISVQVWADLDTLVLGYGIKDRLGQVIFGTNTWHTRQVIERPLAGSSYQFRIAFQANLGPGSYSVQTALVDRDTHLTANYDWCDHALVFEVINSDRPYFLGCVWTDPMISIESGSVDV